MKTARWLLIPQRLIPLRDKKNPNAQMLVFQLENNFVFSCGQSVGAFGSYRSLQVLWDLAGALQDCSYCPRQWKTKPRTWLGSFPCQNSVPQSGLARGEAALIGPVTVFTLTDSITIITGGGSWYSHTGFFSVNSISTDKKHVSLSMWKESFNERVICRNLPAAAAKHQF